MDQLASFAGWRIGKRLRLLGAVILLSAAAAMSYSIAGWPRPLKARVAHQLLSPMVQSLTAAARRPDLGPRWSTDWDSRATRTALMNAAGAACPDRVVDVPGFENQLVWDTSLTFAYQDFHDPRLAKLARRLDLPAVIAGSSSEIDTLRRVTSFVRGLADHTELGVSHKYPHDGAHDAFSILDAIERRTTLECHEYSLILIQSLAALGYTSRLVSAGYAGRNEHAAVEVWSSTYRKWILLDPDNDLLYVRDGIPLSGYEVQEVALRIEQGFQAWLLRGEDRAAGSTSLAAYVAVNPAALAGVTPERGTVKALRIPAKLARSPTRAFLELYRSFSISLRNDYLSATYLLWNPQRWAEAALPAGAANWLVEFDGQFIERLTDLYWPLDIARMAFEPAESGCAVHVQLGTTTPGFRAFRIAVNGHPIADTTDASFLWNLESDRNTLEVTTVNAYAREGARSGATVALGPGGPRSSGRSPATVSRTADRHVSRTGTPAPGELPRHF